MMISVSVIIPSFNRPAETLRAVRSALAQTLPVGEVVVVDDASDPPLDAAMLENLDARVRVGRTARNGGAAAARQFGIDMAGGEVLAFLDSDDAWHEDKLALQVPLLLSECRDARPVAVACGWMERHETGALGRIRIPVPSTGPLDFVSGCWFCPGSTVIMRRRSFTTVGPFDTRLRRLEDLDWFARFGLAGGRLLVVPEVAVTIAAGRRSSMATVEPAVSAILAKPVWRHELGRRGWRRLRAWLEVERLQASLNDGHLLRGLVHYARSQVFKPRLRLQLLSWWTSSTAPVRRRGA